MNYQVTIIGGRLTHDPELRFLPKGTAVCEFDIAVTRKYKSNNEDREETSFIPCTAFAKTAEVIAERFRKGSPILVQGYIKQETWTDKATGQNRSKLKVQVETFQFVEGKDQQPSSTPPRANPAPRKAAPVEDDDSPPF